MPSYTLNIDFSAADLGTLFPGSQNIVITKQIGGDGRGLVAWLALKPGESHTVNWSEDYALYATTSGEHTASPQVLEWQSGHKPGLTLPVDTVGLVNQYLRQPGTTFGLEQEARISATELPASSINATLGPMDHQAAFQLPEKIQVFMQSNIDSSMVLAETNSNAIDLIFGAGVNEQTIVYSPEAGGFVLKPHD